MLLLPQNIKFGLNCPTSVPCVQKTKRAACSYACNPLIFLRISGADCRFRTGHLMITNLARRINENKVRQISTVESMAYVDSFAGVDAGLCLLNLLECPANVPPLRRRFTRGLRGSGTRLFCRASELASMTKAYLCMRGSRSRWPHGKIHTSPSAVVMRVPSLLA